VILTNPPFGGKEGKDAQKNFAFETSATQVLFVQDILAELAPPAGPAGGIVLDEGLLFRTNESAFVETKRKLVDECDLWAIVSLPGGVFSTAGAGVKTNLLFFTKGKKTERIWYYDLSHVKVGKKTPLTLAHFGLDKAAAAKIGEMESAIREHEKAARDLEAEAATIDAAVFDLKAVNPNVVTVVDERTPAQLIASANEHGKLVTQALNRLTALLAQS
jgi:type I restriction-modification system DNA methylase subunit